MTDPPENVFINAPSDKLSLAEGSKGPRLSCEAAGEPQVQYRWFLLPSGADLSYAGNYSNGNSPRPASSKRSTGSASMVKALKQPRQSEPANSIDQEQAINQPANKALDPISANIGGANDISAPVQRGESLIELTGSSATTERETGSSISVLDLSTMSLDRRQAGHYICEASNRLGKTRQSVSVNVQCEYSLKWLSIRICLVRFTRFLFV